MSRNNLEGGFPTAASRGRGDRREVQPLGVENGSRAQASHPQGLNGGPRLIPVAGHESEPARSSQSPTSRVSGISGRGSAQSSHDRELELAIFRKVAGALRSTIDAHGPITQQYVGSAAKRIAAQIVKGD